jgi:hypothetical protein
MDTLDENFFNIDSVKVFLKTGPGSPGESATFHCNYYGRLTIQNPKATWENLFELMFLDKILTYQKIDPENIAKALLENQDIEDHVTFSQGDICLFTFMMLYLESGQFRFGVGASDTLGITLEVIREVVHSLLPNMIKLDFAEYKRRAIYFTKIIKDG